MLNPAKITRTTFALPEELLFEVKKKALMEKKNLKEIISEALNFYLKYDLKENLNNAKKADKLFGVWKDSKPKNMRNNKSDKKRENYLKNLWKKS